MNFPKSAAEPAKTAAPNSAYRALILGVPSMAHLCRLARCTKVVSYLRYYGRAGRTVAIAVFDPDRSRAEPAFAGGCSMLCCDPLPSSAGGQRSLISRPRFPRHLCPEGLKSNDHLPVQGIGPHFRTIPHQLVGGVGQGCRPCRDKEG